MLAAAWRELGRFHALVGINIRRPQAELHHRSAIEMARTAKAEGLDQADLSQIADDIIRTQQAEIDQMTDWRRDWFGSGEIDSEGAALGLAETEMGMQHVATISSAPRMSTERSPR